MNRVTDLADPRRCQAAAQKGQCHNIAEEGSKFCLADGGNPFRALAEKKRQYHLIDIRDQNRVTEFAEHESVKSLRDEIGLVKRLIEEIWNICKTPEEKKSATPLLTANIRLLKDLVKDAHLIEQSLGSLLSKSTVIKLMQTVCQIVIEELEGVEGYEEIVDRIGRRVMQTVSNTRDPDETQQSSVLLLPAPENLTPAE